MFLVRGVGEIRDLVCSLTEIPGRGAYLKNSVGPYLYRGPGKGFGTISLHINSSAVGAHARKYKKPPSSRLQQNTKQKINKKLRCILIDKNIHHHAHHRNSGKLDDTDRAEERK